MKLSLNIKQDENCYMIRGVKIPRDIVDLEYRSPYFMNKLAQGYIVLHMGQRASRLSNSSIYSQALAVVTEVNLRDQYIEVSEFSLSPMIRKMLEDGKVNIDCVVDDKGNGYYKHDKFVLE